VIFPLPQAVRARAVLERLRGLMEAHTCRAVIDRRYPLAAIVDASAEPGPTPDRRAGSRMTTAHTRWSRTRQRAAVRQTDRLL